MKMRKHNVDKRRAMEKKKDNTYTVPRAQRVQQQAAN
jgi:hypothetical protein